MTSVTPTAGDSLPQAGGLGEEPRTPTENDSQEETLESLEAARYDLRTGVRLDCKSRRTYENNHQQQRKEKDTHTGQAQGKKGDKEEQ